MYRLLRTYLLNPYRPGLGFATLALAVTFVTRLYHPTSVNSLPTSVYGVLTAILGLGGLLVLGGVLPFERGARVEPLQAGLILAGGGYLSYALAILFFNPSGSGVAAIALALAFCFFVDAHGVARVARARRELLKHIRSGL